MKLILSLIFLSQVCLGVTENFVWKIPDGGVLPAWGLLNNKNDLTPNLTQTSPPAVSFGTTSASNTDIPGFSVTITTSGRPVMIIISGSGFFLASSSGGGATDTSGSINVRRNGGATSPVAISKSIGCRTSPAVTILECRGSGFSGIDSPPAGTHTYQVRMIKGTLTTRIDYFSPLIINAYEL